MQDEISSTRVETVYLSRELGQFEVEPLTSGFGLTIGNALRRVLLSSLSGAAVSSIQIQGVYHEFSTIPGVREDTTELILNLKQVRLKSYTDEPVTVRLESVGPGTVTAGDIQAPPEIEIVNPELLLATLDGPDAKLEMLLTVEKGRGYRRAEGQEDAAIGVVPIDAVFTPIRRVNYRVEKTRVGARTDFDKLLLEIQTDGTIGPKEALAEAAQVLLDQFQIFTLLTGPIQRSEKAVIGGTPIPSRLQDMPIEVLNLSSRTYNCLKRSQITTVGQLSQMSDDELLSLRNFGQKSLDELKEKLAEHGLLGQEEEREEPAAAEEYVPEEAGEVAVEEIMEEEFAEEEEEFIRPRARRPRARRRGGEGDED